MAQEGTVRAHLLLCLAPRSQTLEQGNEGREARLILEIRLCTRWVSRSLVGTRWPGQTGLTAWLTSPRRTRSRQLSNSCTTSVRVRRGSALNSGAVTLPTTPSLNQAKGEPNEVALSRWAS